MSLTPPLFTSIYADGPDATKFRPSDLNRITGLLTNLLGTSDPSGAILMRDTGVSDGASWIAAVAVGAMLVSAGVGTPPVWSVTPTLTGSLTIAPTIDPAAALLLQGDDNNAATIAIHNNYAIGMDIYTHASQGFRAPYLNFYKTRGTQASPTPPTLTGYELDSIGGINFGGWNGSAYVVGAAIYSQVDQDWSVGNTGAHISIYARNNGSSTLSQVAQFGGMDAPDSQAHNVNGLTNNILFFRPLNWTGNSANNPGIVPSSSPALLTLRTGDNSGFAGLSVGTLKVNTLGAFAASDKYVVVDAAGNLHRSALGPAS